MSHYETALPKPKPRAIPFYKLNEMIENGNIVLDAPYQRDIVWDTKKMCGLIDSMFNNFYIPPVIFAVRKVKQKTFRFVIDGKQRLTSARRFARNLIPYRDMSSGTPVNRYYSDQDEGGKDNLEEAVLRARADPQNFLTPSMFEAFNGFEFVCIEYEHITIDDEYDIFYRVQLGKPITSAERLKAHNTPKAELCRTYCIEYPLISSIFQNSNSDAQLFQYILQIMHITEVNDPKHFIGTFKALTDYVSAKEEPSRLTAENMVKILSLFTNFAANETLKESLLRYDVDKTCLMRTLEVLIFSKYITRVQRPRNPSLYANDFINLRDYLKEKREGNIRVGKDSIVEGFRWIEQYITENDLRAVRRSRTVYAADPEDDLDELKYDEYEEDTPVKRSSEARHRGLSVARRGGKFPSKRSRF